MYGMFKVFFGFFGSCFCFGGFGSVNEGLSFSYCGWISFIVSFFSYCDDWEI